MTTPSSLGEQIKAQVKMFAQFSAREGMDVFTMQSLARTEFLALVDALVSLAEASTPAREAGAVGGWIGVDERLPAPGTIVAVLVKEWGEVPVTAYINGDDEWVDSDVFNIPTPHHWLELPMAPLYTQEKAE